MNSQGMQTWRPRSAELRTFYRRRLTCSFPKPDAHGRSMGGLPIPRVETNGGVVVEAGTTGGRSDRQMRGNA